jgi:hypothetical protein
LYARRARFLVVAGSFGALMFGAGLFLDSNRTSAVVNGCPARPPVTEHRITRPRWVSGAVITEYYAIRESWFSGRLVSVPGLRSRHRVDWLYGPHGVAMNGEGLGAGGRFYHFDGPYDVGWVNENGNGTIPCWNGRWTGGKPAWLAFGWRNQRGAVTFPLAIGGWSNGVPKRYMPAPPSLRFALGRSRQLPFWGAVATDPRVIPYGSRVFVPSYCGTPARGWFRALDTGGAIIGFHLDVYRPPPPTLVLRELRGQRIYVVPPGAASPRTGSVGC